MFWLGQLSADEGCVVCPSRFASQHPPASPFTVFELKKLSRLLGIDLHRAWHAEGGFWLDGPLDDVVPLIDAHPNWQSGVWNARFDPAQNELILSHAAPMSLVEALAQHVANSDDAFLVAEGGPGQSFYVQLMRDEAATVIEAVSNVFLERNLQLSSGQVAKLRLLGFSLATDEHGQPANYQYPALNSGPSRHQQATWMRAVLETIYEAPTTSIQFRAAEPMDPMASEAVGDLQRLLNQVDHG